MSWFRKLFGICGHKWNIIASHLQYEDAGDSMPSGKIFVLQCQHCGDVKKSKI